MLIFKKKLVSSSAKNYWLKSLRVLFLAVLAIVFSLQSSGATEAAADSRLIGIAVSINDPANAIALTKLLGVNSVRIDAPWAQIETTFGDYQIPPWLDQRVTAMVNAGIAPLLILSYSNKLWDNGDKPTSAQGRKAFADYAAFLVNYFKGKVFHYDLWNEWDAHTGRTTPLGADEYVHLAKAVYPVVKAIDRRIQLLSGGISDKGMREGFFDRFFQLKGQRYIDALSVHPYIWNNRNEKTPEAAIEMLDKVAFLAKAANNGVDMPMYVTELGWPTHEGRFGISEIDAASFLTRYMLLASSRAYIKGVFWYCLMDQGNDPQNKEHRFGVLDRTQQARPAAIALKNLAPLLKADSTVTIQISGNLYKAVISKPGQPATQVEWQNVPAGTAEVGLPRWRSANTTSGSQ